MKQQTLFYRKKEVPTQKESELDSDQKGRPVMSFPYLEAANGTVPLIQENKVIQNEKLNSLLTKSHRILLKISSAFPFEIFPDTIVVDENKIDIIQRIFFGSEKVFTVQIKDIKRVTVTSNPIFASMAFEVVLYEAKPDPVRFLWRHQAERARRIINGLITCSKEGLDLSKFEDTNLVPKIEEIGKTEGIH